MLDPRFAQARAQHSSCRFMLPVRARSFCGPSLRSSPGLDIPNHRSTLQVRARFFVSAHAQFSVRCEPSLRSGSRLAPWKIGNASSSRPIVCEAAVRTPFVSAHPLTALHVRKMILLYMALRRARAAKSSHVLTMLRGAGKSLPRSFRLLQC